MKIQKNRSKSKKNDELSEWVIINNNVNSSVFMGYDHLEVEGYICKYREAKSQDGKTNYHIVTDVTTFYPEGGGQIGDTGEIVSSGVEIPVIDTFKDITELVEDSFVAENRDLLWVNGKYKGYVSMNISEEFIDVSYKYVSTVKSREYKSLEPYTFRVEHNKPYSASNV